MAECARYGIGNYGEARYGICPGTFVEKPRVIRIAQSIEKPR